MEVQYKECRSCTPIRFSIDQHLKEPEWFGERITPIASHHVTHTLTNLHSISVPEVFARIRQTEILYASILRVPSGVFHQQPEKKI